MGSLAGLSVLITRPEGQAETWLSALASCGAEVFHQPGLAIIPADPDEPSLRLLASPAPDATVVCTSIPAANAAFSLQPGLESMPCWAVGRQTARRLIELGCRRVYTPESAAGSEALLADPRFPGPGPVLIACARGGRQLILERLRAENHQADPVYVYQRKAAKLVPGLIEQLAETDHPLIVVATSLAILDRVHELLSPQVLLSRCPLVVVSERIADRARELGYERVVVSEQPGLDSVLTAIQVAAGRFP